MNMYFSWDKTDVCNHTGVHPDRCEVDLNCHIAPTYLKVLGEEVILGSGLCG